MLSRTAKENRLQELIRKTGYKNNAKKSKDVKKATEVERHTSS